MSAIRLEGFRGIIPRLSKRLLPDNAAVDARNVKLLSGELRGFNSPLEFADFTAEAFTVRKAHRIQYEEYGDTVSTWLLFDTRDIDVVRSPVINDLFDRYYWAGDGRPMYSTRNRIINGLDPHFLGVPTPGTAPTITPPAGVVTTTRSYVYTFVSEYGEEGPPSEPTTATGVVGTWVVSGMQTTVPDASNRNINKKRIYRTVPGNATSTFFLVAEILLTDAVYADLQTDASVASNNVLESLTWFEPDASMEGFVVMPGGYLAGWAGKRLMFSEPYRPHAWPPQYEIATENEIVGMSVWGDLLVVGTVSNPYVGQGVTPGAFFARKLGSVEPCLSRRGIISTVFGVYYPSLNGLAFVNTSGVSIITKDIVTKREWDSFFPDQLYAAQLGMQYIAFSAPNRGFVFDPSEPGQPLVTLDAFDGVEGIETDPYNGTVTLIAQDRAWEWDAAGQEPIPWLWRSKEFMVPRPCNFGAGRVRFVTDDIDASDAVDASFGEYNDDRFVAPLPSLNTLAGHALCASTQNGGQVPGTTLPEIRLPLGGGPLYPIGFLSTLVASVRLIVYADGVIKFDKTIFDEKVFRMPAGFKADVWQFELTGNANMYSLQIATTAKELDKV